MLSKKIDLYHIQHRGHPPSFVVGPWLFEGKIFRRSSQKYQDKLETTVRKNLTKGRVAQNFINHFRQADTGLELPRTKVTESFLRNISVAQSKGAGGECGTQCTIEPRCQSWSYTPVQQTCTLSSAPLTAANLAPDAVR